MDFTPNGICSGVGSVCRQDASRAVRNILQDFGNLPWWPQMMSTLDLNRTWFGQPPSVRVRKEKLILPCKAKDSVAYLEKYFASDKGPKPLQTEPGYDAFHGYFAKGNVPGRRMIKGQSFGPLVLASMLEDRDGNSLKDNLEVVEFLCAYVAEVCFKQARDFRELGIMSLIVLDEPSIGMMSDKMICGPLFDLIRELNSEMRVGLHCCGTADWSTICRLGLDYLSFDMFSYLDDVLKHKNSVSKFMKEGGVLALGVVPTFPLDVPLELLAFEKFLKGGIDELRGELSFKEFQSKTVLTPACGTAGHSLDREEKIHAFLLELGKSMASGKLSG
jgi:hypothetical protein